MRTAGIRTLPRSHPQWGAVLAVGVAWLVVIGQAVLGPAHYRHSASGLSGLPAWAVMCVAMMVPTALPAVRHVATNSLRRRRQRAVAAFLLAYTGAWLAFGAMALPALALVHAAGVPEAVVLASTLGLAAAWQVLPGRRWFRWACHRTVPLPPLGWRATVGCLRFGGWHGLACVGLCWPFMLIMATSSASPAPVAVLSMLVLACLSAAVKLIPPSRGFATPLAVALAGVAVMLLVLTGGSATNPDHAPHSG